MAFTVTMALMYSSRRLLHSVTKVTRLPSIASLPLSISIDRKTVSVIQNICSQNILDIRRSFTTTTTTTTTIAVAATTTTSTTTTATTITTTTTISAVVELYLFNDELKTLYRQGVLLQDCK